jgi:hypothetical protein
MTGEHNRRCGFSFTMPTHSKAQNEIISMEDLSVMLLRETYAIQRILASGNTQMQPFKVSAW